MGGPVYKQEVGVVGRSALDRAASELPFADLARLMEPMLGGLSRTWIPGYEPEDVHQELLIILWRCQGGWDPSRSAFLTYARFALANGIAKLVRASQRHYQPVAALRCERCGVEIPLRARGGVCAGCGGARWTNVGAANLLLSLDAGSWTDVAGRP